MMSHAKLLSKPAKRSVAVRSMQTALFRWLKVGLSFLKAYSFLTISEQIEQLVAI